ncbi:MAG: histidine triad nucleotide-binding protein [Chlamydiales bacterium]
MVSNYKTIFERVADGELEAEKVYEDPEIFVIKDKFPKAPVHLLIITKKVISDLQTMAVEDLPLLGKIVVVAQKMAQQFGLAEKGYRLTVNNGMNAGQTIYHLHFHLMGGGLLGEMA